MSGKINDSKIKALLKEKEKEEKFNEMVSKIKIHPPLGDNWLSTTDYSIFKKHEHQRNCDQRKTNKIIKSIKNIGYYPQPISVTSDMRVPIGRHRIESAKYFNFPVYYFFVEDIDQDVIVGLEASTKWNAEDKLQSCCSAGIPSAIAINNLRNEWIAKKKKIFNNGKNFSVPHILAIVLKDSNLLSEVNKIDLIKKLTNTPVPTRNEIKFANEFINVFLYIQSNCMPTGIRSIEFQRAIIDVIVENESMFNFNSFIKKLKNITFDHATSVRGYKIQIIDLYNKRISKLENKIDYNISLNS